MKDVKRIGAILFVLFIAGAFLTFKVKNRPSLLTATEEKFVGIWYRPSTWYLPSEETRIEFKTNRSFFDGEFRGRWQIVDGNIIMKTWRDAPIIFDYETANKISKPVVNAWDSVISEELTWEIVIVDENTVRLHTGDDRWETWVRSE